MTKLQQQQQVEKRRPLTLPQPSELAAAIGRDWREPKKLQLALDSWVKQQHPVIEVMAATIAGSGQVRTGRAESGETESKKRNRKTNAATAACCRLSLPLLPLLGHLFLLAVLFSS